MSSDSDIAQAFKALRERSKAKKISNIEFSTMLLIEKGFNVDIRNNGVHLIVSHNDKVVDFWPSTGKFIVRNGKTSRGVKRLIKELEQESSK